MDELEAAGPRSTARRARPLPPALAAPLRDRLARERARLEHLAPALVGPPAAGLGVPERPPDRRGDRARGVRRVRLDRADARARTCSTLGSRRRSGRSRRSAGPRRRRSSRRWYPGDAEHDRARDHPPLGEPDDLQRARADRRDPVQRRDHPHDGARGGRPADVEEPRHRPRPARADRAPRRGRDALRTAEADLLAGRALLRRRDRGGPQACEQALERLALDPRERRRATQAEQRPAALEERWILARLDQAQAEVERALRGLRLLAARRACCTTLTFDDFCDWYAEAIKPRLYDGDEDAQATALANLERLLKLLHPVLPHVTEEIWSNLPDRESTADRRALAGAARRAGRRRRVRADPDARPRSSGARRAAAARRRRAADLRRGRQARPRQGRRRQRRGRGRAAPAARSRGPRRCWRTSASSPNAPADVVEAEREKLERYRRELDALASDWLESLSPVAGGVRPRSGCTRCWPSSASRSAPFQRSTSSARTASRPRPACRAAAPAARGAERRRVHLAARARLERADPASTGRTPTSRRALDARPRRRPSARARPSSRC